jgi:hypothetical protein
MEAHTERPCQCHGSAHRTPVPVSWKRTPNTRSSVMEAHTERPCQCHGRRTRTPHSSVMAGAGRPPTTFPSQQISGGPGNAARRLGRLQSIHVGDGSAARRVTAGLSAYRPVGLSTGEFGKILLAELGCPTRPGGGAGNLLAPKFHPANLAGDGFRQLVELQSSHSLEWR